MTRDPTGPTGLVSAGNSTTTPLGAGAEFVGVPDDVTDYAIAYVSVWASHASATDGLTIERSPDGTNWDHVDAYTVPAGTGKTYAIQCDARFLRVRLLNGGTPQTALRMSTLFKRGNGKPSSHRIQDAITDDDDAELVKAVLTARVEGGSFRNVDATTDGRLKVSQSLTAPSAAATVTQTAFSSLSANQTVDLVYTITAGTTLTLQRLLGGGQPGADGGRVELYHRDNAGAALQLISVAYVQGSNFQFDIDQDFVGDGNRQIVLRRVNASGGSLSVFAQWQGYEG